MKMTKTFAALGILGAALLAFASCKDSSGDALITGADSGSGVPQKYALKLTVDATGDKIKVGDKALIDSNLETTETIIADDASTGDADLKLSKTGKRAFNEITGGFNNTEGFRTNIVLDLKEGTWKNSTSGRTAGAGMLFDFNKYENDTYDFFFLSFKPVFGGSGGAFSGVTCYFERYSGVKKTKSGIYSGHAAAGALGCNYTQEVNTKNPSTTQPVANPDYTLKTVGTWYEELYEPSADATCKQNLSSVTDYVYDSTAGTVVIGVDVKQLEKGVYTVRIGKISYTVGDTSETAQEFKPSIFKQSWHTRFAPGTTMGEGGETSAKTGASGYIPNYTKWTHIKSDDKDTNLKGGVLVYGFAPYGTKPVASYYTCNTQLRSGQTDSGDNTRYDYVGDWNVANELNEDGVQSKVFYEEGNVIQEYVYY